MAPHCPAVFPTVTLAGQVIPGASVSSTVTVNEHESMLPDASATVQVTVVVPAGKKDPDAGVQTGVPTSEQSSEAVGAG